MVAILFTAYSMYGLIGYVSIFAQEFYGLSAASAATLGGIRYLIQGFGGIIGGFIADKLKSRFKVIILGCIGLALSFGALIFIPENGALCSAVIVDFFIGLFFIYAVRSQYFAVHDDAGIPVHMSGRVSGIASCLGYMPDLFLYTLVGSWMDNYGRTGYNMTWAYAIGCAIVCIIITFALSRIVKKTTESCIKTY